MNDKVHARSEWRNALEWILCNWRHAVFIVVLLVIAGVLSVFGLLRWDQSFFRWSFAALSWVSAAAIVYLAFSRRRSATVDSER